MSPRRILAAAALLLLAGCAQQDGPTGIGDPGKGDLPKPLLYLDCTVELAEPSISCEAADSAAAAGALGAVLGGGGPSIGLISDHLFFHDVSRILSAEVAVRNLLTQALGSRDGVTADPDGIRVFFVDEPVVTRGSGSVILRSSDGVAGFTRADQPFFHYNQMLMPLESSKTRRWEWELPGEVESFSFQVGVSARLADEGSVAPIAAFDAQSITAGQGHSCALTAAGEAWCWGANGSGQLGDGTTIDRPYPIRAAKDLNFVALAAGFVHTCGLTAEGEAWCWGEGRQGRLGNGSTDPQTEPVRVSGGHRFVTISATSSNTCAVTVDGEGYCWGYGTTGRNGDGAFVHRSTPVRVQGGHEFRMIAAAHFHTCGVTTSGDAWCWGDNNNARRGDGTFGGAQSATPVKVAGGRKFVTVAGGEHHTCALAEDGSAWCWGVGEYGRLGTGAVNDTALVPTAVAGGVRFQEIGAGESHTCGLSVEGEVWCWGRDNHGQLGNGPGSANALTPQRVAGGYNFSALAVGFDHACAATKAGRVYCWGQGASGQIGDGSSGADRPVEVELIDMPTGPDGGILVPYGSYLLEQLPNPDRIIVRDGAQNWLATYTNGSYTALFAGPSRTYAEGGRTLISKEWVRILPMPFEGTVDTLQLEEFLADRSPDVIEVAMQYVAGAPPIFDKSGLQIAGDAGYGDGIGADFHDYLGIDWTYPSGTKRTAREKFFRKLDCSGYVRMVYGYRGAPNRIPLSITVWNTTIPRVSYNQYYYGTGVILIEHRRDVVPAVELSVLQPGDLVFFDSSSRLGEEINHVGIYLGVDVLGRMRFVSSLPSVDGPIFGRSSGSDYVLDGTGFWARALRGARRL